MREHSQSDDVPANVVIGDSVLHQAIQDEAVLLNLNTQQYFGLNPGGARMWNLLIECGDVAQVVSRLEAEYNADASTIRSDLDQLVRKLLSHGLIKAA
jgi:hypothetical protein